MKHFLLNMPKIFKNLFKKQSAESDLTISASFQMEEYEIHNLLYCINSEVNDQK